MATASSLSMVALAPEDALPYPSERVLEETERHLGQRLPASYVELMRVSNGGYFDEHLIECVEPIPDGFRYYLEDGRASINGMFGISPDPDAPQSIAGSVSLVQAWLLPAELVLLDGDGHTWIALDYRDSPDEPAVVFVVSDEAPVVVRLASNFAEFLARLTPSSDLNGLSAV